MQIAPRRTPREQTSGDLCGTTPHSRSTARVQVHGRFSVRSSPSHWAHPRNAAKHSLCLLLQRGKRATLLLLPLACARVLEGEHSGASSLVQEGQENFPAYRLGVHYPQPNQAEELRCGGRNADAASRRSGADEAAAHVSVKVGERFLTLPLKNLLISSSFTAMHVAPPLWGSRFPEESVPGLPGPVPRFSATPSPVSEVP